MRWVRIATDSGSAVGYLEGEEIVVTQLEDVLSALTGGAYAETGRVPFREDALLAPLLPVRNVHCIGWNYLPHFDERQSGKDLKEIPELPTFFSKATGSVAGPYESLPAHTGLAERLDWEVELGIVIGREAVNVNPEDALDLVVGYFVSNDISARDLQRGHGGQWYKGKSLDGTCPIGPWVVTADEVPNPQDLDISCSLNGETMQSSNTKHMIFPIASIISHLSQGMTLYPGDIILTGTPEGVGQAQDPPRFLVPGDVLESTVTGIGTIRNPFR